ncbi:MAG: DUF4352 domain-containing protein [Oscillospiraceae bacterium]|nr:DUF4352 domain-containing protein [Oscillospiraceae bacterium]
MNKEKPTVKQCKHCKSEIPYDAKVCPVCRKKQGAPGCLIVVLVVVVLVVIAAFAGSGESSTPQKVESTSGTSQSASQAGEAQPQPEQTVFTVGDAVELNGVKTTLLSAEEYPGKQYMMPTDGNVFLVCQFEIENDSSAEINVSSMVSFNAYCDDYSVSLSVTGEMLEDSWKTLDGTVAPGKKINGVIAYEIPQDWQKMEISYTPSYWSGHDVQFEINK